MNPNWLYSIQDIIGNINIWIFSLYYIFLINYTFTRLLKLIFRISIAPPLQCPFFLYFHFFFFLFVFFCRALIRFLLCFSCSVLKSFTIYLYYNKSSIPTPVLYNLYILKEWYKIILNFTYTYCNVIINLLDDYVINLL